MTLRSQYELYPTIFISIRSRSYLGKARNRYSFLKEIYSGVRTGENGLVSRTSKFSNLSKTNRIANLCLACVKCNRQKGTQQIEQFLGKSPDLLKRIQTTASRPLKDATAVNSTRWALFNRLKQTGLAVSAGSGGLTKFNRTRLHLPKTHWLDAACVGKVESLELLTARPLLIVAKGWGCRQMVQNDKYGFPRKGYRAKQKVKNWNTGDLVAVISGNFAGIAGKRLKTVRFKGNFDIRLNPEKVISVSRHHLKAVHRRDGYEYKFAQV